MGCAAIHSLLHSFSLVSNIPIQLRHYSAKLISDIAAPIFYTPPRETMGLLGTYLSFLLAASLLVSGAVNFQPEQLKSENGALDVTLTVTMEYSLNGTRYSAHYNGGPIGPTLRVKPGDTLTVTLVNDLPTSPARDLQLLAYVQDPSNEATPEGYVNMTIIYNRLSEEGKRLFLGLTCLPTTISGNISAL
mgnify:CR=1 FL=1